jgi:hypothetical protein
LKNKKKRKNQKKPKKNKKREIILLKERKRKINHDLVPENAKILDLIQRKERIILDLHATKVQDQRVKKSKEKINQIRIDKVRIEIIINMIISRHK